MYKNFFGLRESPFNVNPDPRYLFLTQQMREAFDEMTYGIKARKGLILLTGEVGTGKTTLINHLLDWLRRDGTPTAFIFNSHLQSKHLLDFILTDFGVPHDPALDDNARLRLNQWLLERYRAGSAVPVLILDEAQGLMTDVLEEVRMLLNLETPHDKLLQIVLAGQPELEERLKRPELRQIKQRIALRCKTGTLSPEETHNYIEARLRIAGAGETRVFAPEAIDAVHFYSGGIPRIINLLCEHALIDAYVDDLRPVPAHVIRGVAREFQFDDVRHPALRRASSGGCSDSAATVPPMTAQAADHPHPIAEVKASSKKQQGPQTNPELFDIADVLFGLTDEPRMPLEPVANPLDEEGKRTILAREAVTPDPLETQGEQAPPVEALPAYSDTENTLASERKTEEMLPLALSGGIHLVETKKKEEVQLTPSDRQGIGTSKPAPPAASRPARLRTRGWRRTSSYGVRRSRTRANAAWSWPRFSRASLPSWAQMSAGAALEPLSQSVERYLSRFEMEQWLRIKETVSRWLCEPWSPAQRRLLDPQLLAFRRDLSQKKS